MLDVILPSRQSNHRFGPCEANSKSTNDSHLNIEIPVSFDTSGDINARCGNQRQDEQQTPVLTHGNSGKPRTQ